MALHLNGLGGAIERTLMHMWGCNRQGLVDIVHIEIHQNELRIHFAVNMLEIISNIKSSCSLGPQVSTAIYTPRLEILRDCPKNCTFFSLRKKNMSDQI